MRWTEKLGFHFNHYAWLFQEKRDWGVSGLWSRRASLNDATNLQLPPPRNGETTRVHVLIGRRCWERGLWMLASLFHACGKAWPVTFHDDGTCDRTVQAQLMAVAPFAQFLTRADADARMAEQLKAFPHTRLLRRDCPSLVRLLDTCTLFEEFNQLVLSCDLLFFLTPKELLWWDQDGWQESLFLGSAGNLSSELLSAINHRLGIEPLRQLNSGVAALRNGFLDLPLIEKTLVRTGAVHAEQRWAVEHALFAMLAAVKPSSLLPSSYVISAGHTKPATATMRFYVGHAHDQLYSEGLSTMAPILSSRFGRRHPHRHRPTRPVRLPAS
ncbi:MAG: hypothetical protein JO015_22050 [Verrucomicrobia bacterium]|nr:hypothetical protein [Verrucomicrobiota bacterium]